MSRRFFPQATALAAMIALTACQASKSADPLSPSVAGPIPGVNISAPIPTQPNSGAQVTVEQQPVTLTIQNAASSGVRPLVYSFEVATDTDFSNKLFSREGVTPGEGKTSLKLPEALPTGHSYYWRSKAQDGANTGPFSSVSTFKVFTPVVIQAPIPSSPLENVKTENLHPRFNWTNAPRSGPTGTMQYVIEISPNDRFDGFTAIWLAAEQPNQSSLESPQNLAYGTQYFWHLRAYDPTTTGPWSATQVFQTPPAPPPPPTGPPPGPPPIFNGPAPNDSIDLGRAVIHNSPSDVASWPATAKITRLDLGTSGAHVEFTKQNEWPDVTYPGWGGPLQYTLWIVLNINGQWHASGCIEFWKGLNDGGGPVSGYAQDWYYDPIRWGPMAGHQPQPGEQVGFLVTAGDARNNGGTALRERSNVVVVSFPTNNGGSFSFSAGSIRFQGRR